MRYLSVCSGIEAATVAWHHMGWAPLAFSEIEKFPRAVLAHHYPDVPLHGDFTRLRDETWIADADVLVGGTPCQAFSVAGQRASLSDDRGNLTLEFVRLADAIDDVRRVGGRSPCIVVWENVPGVLSVKDNAFGCFLAGLVGEVEPLVPPRGKWTNAGMVVGPQRRAAWRILDAQYFGVAQRRRRVFVVASARDGFDPAEVLFECEGVRRDTPPRREAGQGTAAATAPSLTASGRGVDRTGDTRGQDPVVAVAAFGGNNQTGPIDVATARNACASPSGRLDFESETFIAEVAGTIGSGGTQAKSAGTATSQDAAAGLLVAHSLRGEGFDASEDGTGRGTPLVPVAHAFDARQSDVIQYGDMTGPLDTDRGTIGVLTPMAVHENQRAELTLSDTAGAMKCAGGKPGQGYPAVLAFSAKDHGGDATHDLAPTLRAMPHDGSHANGGGQMAVAVPTLTASNDPSRSPQSSEVTQQVAAVHAASMAVRRLTPVECERLQGFSDGYTRISDKTADGPRYKALGNSMAVPVMRWIGERINKVTAP